MGQKRRQCGFTLLELVVTVSVIAVLLLILLTGMGRLRDQANRVQCITIMRTLAGAVSLYANDSMDQIMDDNTDGGKTGSRWGWSYAYVSWRNPLDSISGAIPAGVYEPGRLTLSPTANWDLAKTFKQDRMNPYVMEQLVRRGQMWPYVRSYKFYLCPSERPPFVLTSAQAALAMASAPSRTDNQFPANSGNVWVTADDFYAGRYVSAYKMNKSINDKLKRLSQATKTNVFLFWEADETIFSVDGWAAWNDGGNNNLQGLTPRHGDKGATVALLDGSAEYILRAKFATSNRFDPMP